MTDKILHFVQNDIMSKVQKTEEEWKKILTPRQFEVLRNKGTEAPFSGEFVNKNDEGMYSCAACGNPLFSSEAKFELDKLDPNSGWPSFYDVASKGNVILEDDDSHGMNRVEVKCANCGGHLGHLFNDLPRGPLRSEASKAGGPKDKTGLHYCINSYALKFNPSADASSFAKASKDKKALAEGQR